jgi:crossover junction endodeoxyribonuclease RuvC
MTIRIIGIDPGLRRTGWGVIESTGAHLAYIACGTVTSDATMPLCERLSALFTGLTAVLADWQPHEAAVEETFVNRDPAGTLKLGQARGIALLVPARAGIAVAEYAPNAVKKAVVGVGHAAKDQVAHMVRVQLPGVVLNGPDSADALAVAICHAHHLQSAGRLAAAIRGAA